MRNRFRFFAALLALLALSSSAVEQAWAAACVGMHSAVAEMTAESADVHPHGAAAPRSPDSGEQRSHSSSEPGSCPMVSAAGMACGALALPMASVTAPLGAEVRLGSAAAGDQAPRSLALSSLFRPPRQ